MTERDEASTPTRVGLGEGLAGSAQPANARFSSWATSSAFYVSLTPPQIAVLLYMREHGFAEECDVEPCTAYALLRRGLADREGETMALTRAGALLAELAHEAGFTAAAPAFVTRAAQARAINAKVTAALELCAAGLSPTEAAARAGIGRSTVYKHLKPGSAG